MQNTNTLTYFLSEFKRLHMFMIKNKNAKYAVNDFQVCLRLKYYGVQTN